MLYHNYIAHFQAAFAPTTINILSYREILASCLSGENSDSSNREKCIKFSFGTLI